MPQKMVKCFIYGVDTCIQVPVCVMLISPEGLLHKGSE